MPGPDIRNVLSGTEMLAKHFPNRPIIIGTPQQRVLGLGDKAIVYGDEGTWKSSLVMHTGLVISNGKDWFDINTNPNNVLIVQVEIPPVLYQSRLSKYIRNSRLDPSGLFIWTETNFKVDSPDSYLKLKAVVAEHNIKLIIFDPLYRMATVNLSSPHDIVPLLDRVDQLIDELNISVMFVNHFIKQDRDREGHIQGRGADDMLSSSALGNWANTIIRINMAEDSDDIQLVFNKSNYTEERLGSIWVHVDRATLGFSSNHR